MGRTEYNILLKEYNKINLKIHNLEDKIKKFPSGKISCVQNGKYIKCYKSDGHNITNIPSRSRELREQMVGKKFYSYQLEELYQQEKIIARCINNLKEISIKSTSLLDNKSIYKKLLQSYFQISTNQLQEWSTNEYEHNPNYPENLVHSTLAGHKVRSKSEVIIANALFINKIPYRYECAIEIKEITIYPDFTIMHPETLKITYWEHFGLMDNYNYQQSTFNKLKIYAQNNIIPSINLITTYETLNYPLDSEQIQQIIEEKFLK